MINVFYVTGYINKISNDNSLILTTESTAGLSKLVIWVKKREMFSIAHFHIGDYCFIEGNMDNGKLYLGKITLLRKGMDKEQKFPIISQSNLSNAYVKVFQSSNSRNLERKTNQVNLRKLNRYFHF